MTANETNLLCYAAIQLVKIMARDLGKRALHRTMGNRAFAGKDMQHLQKLCEYIYRVDTKMGELALKVVKQNSPAAQEQELFKAIRSVLGRDPFGTKEEPRPDYKVTVTQEDKEPGEEPTQLPEVLAQGDLS